MTQYACGVDADDESQIDHWVPSGAPLIRYRYGYKVIDCQPRLVGFEDEPKATAAAREAATSVRDQLIKLGGPADVEWWIQKVTSTVEVVYDAPLGGMVGR